jgi:hypothetical protein
MPSDAPVLQRPLRPLWALVVAVVAVVALPRVPFVHLLLLPLAWLGTLVHETGHALGAMAIGGEVESVRVFAYGSGVARSSLPPGVPWAPAFVATCGLVGPAVASVVLLWTGLGPRLARVGMALLGCGLWLEAATLTQGFATAVALGWGAIALLAAWRLHPSVTRLGTLVVAVQLALHVYRGSGYLFMPVAVTGAGILRSDVATIAETLGGHWLLWGALIGGIDVLLLGIGLLGFFFGDRLLHLLGASAETSPAG